MGLLQTISQRLWPPPAIDRFWFPKGHLNIDQRDFLLSFLGDLRPRYCLETGFASGRSALTTLVACDPKLLISVDKNLDYFNGARAHAAILQRKFPALRVIEGDSSAILTEKFLAENFPTGIDFAFIDGDHSFEGCKIDLTRAFSALAPGGVIMVDDYRSGPPNGVVIPEVERAVSAVAKKQNLDVEPWSRNGKGIAIIRIPN